MFGRRVVLGRILGFEIRADVSWVFLFLLILWSLSSGFFPALYEDLAARQYWALGLIGTVGLFVSLLFHEISHSLVARGYGMEVGGITLFLFGGAAEMQSEPATPRIEFLMAGAGPLASLVLAAAFYALMSAFVAVGLPQHWVGVPYYLAFVNTALAVFNLLPAFPMDGGRMLRAGLWAQGKDLKRATKVASRLGQGFGILLMAAGIAQALLAQNFVGGMWWFLIGLFVHGNAGATYTRLLNRLALHGLQVTDLMTRDPVTVEADAHLQEVVDDIVYRYHHHRYPVVQGERLLGCIRTRQIRAITQDQWSHLRVRDVMEPLGPRNSIAADLDAEDALDRLQSNEDGWTMVVRGNALVGVLALRDLRAYLRLREELGRRRA